MGRRRQGSSRDGNYLVASNLLGNIAQGSENVQAELLALLIFDYGNVLNMAEVAEILNATFVINGAVVNFTAHKD